MTQDGMPAKKKLNSLTLAIIIILAVLAVAGAVLSLVFSELVTDEETVIHTLLTYAYDTIYLVGGGILVFGVILVIIRFIQSKLEDPYKPSSVSRFLSAYLTLSLEFFIAAEILRTVVARNTDEIVLLLLIILSRGLLSLIIYLERRWHGTAESE
jgi:uncharacterized membrane protein